MEAQPAPLRCSLLHCKRTDAPPLSGPSTYTTMCIVLYYTTLHYTTLHYTLLYSTPLQCTALHCTALNRTALTSHRLSTSSLYLFACFLSARMNLNFHLVKTLWKHVHLESLCRKSLYVFMSIHVWLTTNIFLFSVAKPPPRLFSHRYPGHLVNHWYR